MTVTATHLASATSQRIEVIALALVICLVIFELVRRKRLLERYALVWLAAGVSVLVLAIWKGLLTTLSHAVGVSYPPSALFVVTFFFVIVMLVNFSTTISRLSDQNTVLAQRLALLQRQLEEQQTSSPASQAKPAPASHAKPASERPGPSLERPGE
jgi:hypothetical protein